MAGALGVLAVTASPARADAPLVDGASGQPAGALGVAAPAAAVQSTAPPLDEARVGWRPGATFDADAGSAAGALQLGARDRAAERLTRHTLAVLDIESGDIGWNHFLEIGGDVAGHSTFISAGVHSGYRHFDGLTTLVEAIQVEGNFTRGLSLVGMGDWEIPDRGPDVYRAALVLRAFPLDDLAVELGGGWVRGAAATVGGWLVPYAVVEWQLPFRGHAWQLSIFAERQLADVELAGLRISWDMGPTLRDLARQTGWRRLR